MTGRRSPTATADSHREGSSITRQPTIDAIRALVAFVDAGSSVSEAARRMGARQPVVSIKLKAFQTVDKTGAILLERDPDGRSLRLTDAGLSALPVMREIVRQYDQLLAHLSGVAESPRQIRLAVGAFGAEFLVPPVLAHVLASVGSPSENFTVRTSVLRGRDRIVGVAEGKFDIAIVSHTPEQVRDALRDAGIREQAVVCRPLLTLPMIVAAGRDSAAATALDKTSQNEPLPLEMLMQWPLIGPDQQSGVRRRLEKAFKDPALLTFAAEGGGWTAAREFARHGLGVAIIPSRVISPRDAADFICRDLDRRFQLEEYVVIRSGPIPTALEQVLSALSTKSSAVEPVRPMTGIGRKP